MPKLQWSLRSALAVMVAVSIGFALVATIINNDRRNRRFREIVRRHGIVHHSGARDGVWASDGSVEANLCSVINDDDLDSCLGLLAEVGPVSAMSADARVLDDARLSQFLAVSKHAKYVALSNGALTDTAAKGLMSCRGLRTLELSRMSIDAAAWQSIASLASLEAVVVRGATLSGLDIARLSASRCLNSLSICDSTATPEVWEAIGRLSQIETLVLAGTNLNDSSLADVAKCTRLKILNLSDVPIQGKGLHYLANLRSLRQLDLSKEIGSLRMQPTLAVNFGDGVAEESVFRRLPDLTIEALPNLPLLSTLRLNGCTMDPKDWRKLSQMRHLEVQCRGSNVPDEFAAAPNFTRQ